MPSLPHTHPVGIRRREFLQVGYSVFAGLGLGAALPGRTADGPRRAKPKHVILVFLTGAPSHLDTFDPKPDAPAEVRGEFSAISTPVPGLRVCEHLPRLASRAGRYALVRSLAHRDHNHVLATHHVLTGHPQPR